MPPTLDPTRRQLLLLEFVERVSQIRTANGFLTDAGATVFFGEQVVLGEDDPDVVVAVVVRDDIVGYQGENVVTTLPIEVQVIAKSNINKPWLITEQVLGDVKAAVELEDRTLGGLVPRKILRSTTRTLPREPGSETVGIGITYVAPMLEAWGRP